METRRRGIDLLLTTAAHLVTSFSNWCTAFFCFVGFLRIHAVRRGPARSRDDILRTQDDRLRPIAELYGSNSGVFRAEAKAENPGAAAPVPGLGRGAIRAARQAGTWTVPGEYPDGANGRRVVRLKRAAKTGEAIAPLRIRSAPGFRAAFRFFPRSRIAVFRFHVSGREMPDPEGRAS